MKKIIKKKKQVFHRDLHFLFKHLLNTTNNLEENQEKHNFFGLPGQGRNQTKFFGRIFELGKNFGGESNLVDLSHGYGLVSG